jgi:hypothetical protein
LVICLTFALNFFWLFVVQRTIRPNVLLSESVVSSALKNTLPEFLAWIEQEGAEETENQWVALSKLANPHNSSSAGYRWMPCHACPSQGLEMLDMGGA